MLTRAMVVALALLLAALGVQSARVRRWKADAEKRDEQARQALVDAKLAAEPHRRAATALASKRAPVGVDVCAAASADFDAALRAERGQ